MLAILCLSSSPDRGCSSGSVLTLWHTSLRRSTVTSLILLWYNDRKPPHGQLREWSTVNCLPHTHSVARCPGCHPYRKHRASLNTPLCSAKLCSAMGSVDSQLDAPLSLAQFIARCICSGSCRYSVAARSSHSFRWSFLICCFSRCCSIFIEWG